MDSGLRPESKITREVDHVPENIHFFKIAVRAHFDGHDERFSDKSSGLGRCDLRMHRSGCGFGIRRNKGDPPKPSSPNDLKRTDRAESIRVTPPRRGAGIRTALCDCLYSGGHLCNREPILPCAHHASNPQRHVLRCLRPHCNDAHCVAAHISEPAFFDDIFSRAVSHSRLLRGLAHCTRRKPLFAILLTITDLLPYSSKTEVPQICRSRIHCQTPPTAGARGPYLLPDL